MTPINLPLAASLKHFFHLTALIDCLMSAGSQKRAALCSKTANQGCGSLEWSDCFLCCHSLLPLPQSERLQNLLFPLSKSIRFSLNGSVHSWGFLMIPFFYPHVKMSVVPLVQSAPSQRDAGKSRRARFRLHSVKDANCRFSIPCFKIKSAAI